MMQKFIMVKIGKPKKRKLSKKSKLIENRGGFINFAEIRGIFLNSVKLGENMQYASLT